MKNKKDSNLSLTLRGYKLLYKICPVYMKWKVIGQILSALIPFFPIYMSSLIINNLTTTKDTKELITLVLITTIGYMILLIIKRLVYVKVNLHNNYAHHTIAFYMLEYQNTMKYTYVEDSQVENMKQEIYNYLNAFGGGLYKLLHSNVIYDIVAIITSISVTMGLFTAISHEQHLEIIGFVNQPYSFVIIILILIISILFKIIMVKKTNAKREEFYSELTTLNTLAMNLENSTYDKYINGANEVIIDITRNSLNFGHIIDKLESTMAKWQSLNCIIDSICTLIIMIYVACKVAIGSVLIGSFMLYATSILKLITNISNVFYFTEEIIYNNRYLKLFFDYMDLPDDRYLGTLPIEKRSDNEYEIEFHNVSFKYPNTNFYALKNVSFKFKIGERLAIVGMNGSGKSTLIKLLSRLYDPTEGSITLNGIDIKKYDYEQYQMIFSVVFQDFHIFSLSIAENVACSLNYDEAKVISCLEKAGFKEKLKELPNGIKTIITKIYDNDGIELSMGEKQKIAIARAIYKDSPFVVLDEPTASLDPISEQEVYNRFNEMVQDKTAIYISHRLSSCRFCDKIAVFDEGNLVQIGNHDTLVKEQGKKYYELWNAQSQYYK